MYISKKISMDLADLMIETNITEKSKYDILVYCFEYIFEQIIYTTIFLLIGLLFHNIGSSFLFILSFYSLRSYGGGIHTHDEHSCAVTSIIVYIATLITTSCFTFYHSIAWLTIFFTCIIIIILLAPVPSPNKSLSKGQKMKLKQNCIISCILLTILFLILFVNKYPQYYGTLTICVILISISMILGLISHRLSKREN